MIEFKPQNFRRISEDSKPSFKIRTADFTTLILIKSLGHAMYGRTRLDKDEIIKNFDAHVDLLLLAWVGKYNIDIFVLDAEDVRLYYRAA